MLPNSIITLVLFLFVVAPGAYAEGWYERRSPAKEQTALREASRIALASLCFTVCSVSLLWLVYAAFPVGFDASAFVTSGQTYVQKHPAAVGIALVLEVGLAIALARFWHWWLTLESPATIEDTDIWHRVFRSAPPGEVPYLRLRLVDGGWLEGRLGHCKYDSDPSQRELVLVPPMYSKRLGEERVELPVRYRFTVVKHINIEEMRVAFMEVPPQPQARLPWASKTGLAAKRKLRRRRARAV